MRHFVSLKLSLIPLAFTALGSTAQQTYYVKHDGDDSKDGKSIANAWATPARVDSTALSGGDSVLFESGFTFRGMVTLPHATSGSAANPIVLSSYGGSKATIDGGDSLGLYLENLGGIVVKQLIFTTSSAGNGTDGVSFFTGLPTNLDYIVLDSVEVYGFGGNGITLGDSSSGGYSNVSITRCLAHDNKGNAGISTYSNTNNFATTNVHIAYCKAYNNPGHLGTPTSTGSGITIGGVNGALVEYCEAYSNGQNNNASAGGPVGIWTYESKNVTIQFCESYNNFAGGITDGGGFDIDGGTQNCIIQYCYSHGNEGAGYALFQYSTTDPFSGNIIRYNISENDGRKNSYGSLSFWGFDAGHQITNSAVFGNTIYVDGTTGIVSGIPSAVFLNGTSMTNIQVENNIFYVGGASGNARLITSTDTPSTAGILFRYNDYYEPGGFNIQLNGTSTVSLPDWRAIGQETDTASPVGLAVDPQLVGPVPSNQTIGASNPANPLSNLIQYKLTAGSPMIDTGGTIVGSGPRDYFGYVVPNGRFDIGANEFGSVLPVRLYSFTGSVAGDHSILTWKVGVEDNVAGYEIQKSVDGIHFLAAAFVTASGNSSYTYTDYNFRSANASYYRIRVVDKNGKFVYSEIIKLSLPGSAGSVYAFQQGTILYIRLNSASDALVDMIVYDVKGRAVMNTRLRAYRGDNLFPILNAADWSKGLYLINISGQNKTVIKYIKE